ncbi:MAG: hypothetical protein HC894_17100 [Microcoleus sp. SM1_3_4]|nr:hypothetical protein [Microcoleus sp. SM1_3_4]
MIINSPRSNPPALYQLPPILNPGCSRHKWLSPTNFFLPQIWQDVGLAGTGENFWSASRLRSRLAACGRSPYYKNIAAAKIAIKCYACAFYN